MRPKHYLYLLLGPWLQAILVLAAASKHGGPAMTVPWVMLALTLPVPFYYWAFEDAPLGRPKLRPAFCLAVRMLGATLLSGLGFLYGLLMLSHRPLEGFAAP